MLRISKIFLATLVVASFFSLFSCNRILSSEKGKIKDGSEFAIFRMGDDKRYVGDDDFIDFHLVMLNAKDSISQNTYDVRSGARAIEGYPMSELRGVKKELFKKLTVGDSAIFRVKTETEYSEHQENLKNGLVQGKKYIEDLKKQEMPEDKKKNTISEAEMQLKQIESAIGKPIPELPAGKFFTYKVKILRVENKTEREKRQKEEMAKKEKEMQEKTAKAEKQEKIDIDAYIKKNNLKPIKTESGLQYVITKEGSGAKPQAGDSVLMNYTGRLANGKLFDTSIESVAKEGKLIQPNRPYKPLGFVAGAGMMIRGWDEAVMLLNKGAKATLIIPSKIGYGMRAAGDIPPGSPLFFEVELVDIFPSKKAKK